MRDSRESGSERATDSKRRKKKAFPNSGFLLFSFYGKRTKFAMPEQARTHSAQKDQKRGGSGGYRYVREPLRGEEADLLSNACRTAQEKLIVWTLLDTGLRVSELCGMTSESIQWQQRQIRVQGKGGPYGKKTKVRSVPCRSGFGRFWNRGLPSTTAFRSAPGGHRKSSRKSLTGRRSAGKSRRMSYGIPLPLSPYRRVSAWQR